MTEDEVEKPKGDFLRKHTELLPFLGIKARNKYHNVTQPFVRLNLSYLLTICLLRTTSRLDTTADIFHMGHDHTILTFPLILP